MTSTAVREKNLRTDPLLMSKRVLAVHGLAFVISGVTVVSILYGSQSLLYFGVLTLGGLACTPLFLKGAKHQKQVFIATVLMICVPLISFLGQAYLFSFWSEVETSVVPALAISYIFFLVGVGALLRPDEFQRVMILTAGAHVLIGIYGIAQWDFESARYAYSRFRALDVHTAVWGEIALGMVLAGILSGRRSLIFVTMIVAVVLIYGTQMRGAGIAIFVAIAAYIFLETNGRSRALLVAVLGLLVLVGAGYYLTDVWEAMRTLLLLDDKHRGLDAGLSGRFVNWQAGFSSFLISPVFGVGPIDPVADYIHNGILKAFAQYGLVVGGPFFVLFALSFTRALRLRDSRLLPCLMAYLVFILPAPRFVNLQVMPLVALLAIGYALNGKRLGSCMGKHQRSGPRDSDR